MEKNQIYTLSLHDALPISAYSADQAKDYSYFYTTWQKGTYKPARKVERKVLMVGSGPIQIGQGIDRKSTRLNSSHVAISYAVFCLNKKITAYMKETK